MLDIALNEDCKSSAPECSGTPRNITLNRRRTTVRLSDERWKSLHEIANLESCRVHDICLAVHETMGDEQSFSDSLRHFIDEYFKSKTAVAINLKAVKRQPFRRRVIDQKPAVESVTLERSLRKAIGV